MLNLRYSQYGMTLIELMVAVAILAILYVLAAPNYSAWIQNQQIRAGAESILNGIQLTRATSVNNNAQARFVLCSLPASSWQVLAISAVAPAPAADVTCGAGVANEIRVQERTSQEGSKAALVTVNNIAGGLLITEVTFNSLGRVVANADATASITQVDVTTPTGTRPLRVTVQPGGGTKMCDPSAVITDPRHC